MSACEKYIRSVCTAANKCSVNGDTFNSAVEKIVLVDKDIDLGTLKFSAPASVTLSSAAEYASNADCTGKAKSKVTGTMPVISNSPAVNFNYLEMNSNTFETLASSFAFQNSDISSPIFRYKGEHTYSGPFSAMFYSTSTVTNTIAAPNGGYIQFQVDPEKKDAVALDAIVVTNAGGVIFGSTNPAIHPEVRNVNIEILQMTALDPDEYTSEARLMTGGLDVAINEVKIKDYSNTIIINTAADTTTNLGANLIISGLYLSNGVVNLSSQAATTAIPYIQLTNLSFLGYSVDCSDMLINNVVMKGSLFRGFNSNNSLSSLYLGNTEVPRGATCEITADGNYYDSNFQSACSWSY